MSAGRLVPTGGNGPGPGEGEGQTSSARLRFELGRSGCMMSCPVCGAEARTTGEIVHEEWCSLIVRETSGQEQDGEPIHISVGTIGIGLSHDVEQSIREARALSRAWAAYANVLERAMREQEEPTCR